MKKQRRLLALVLPVVIATAVLPFRSTSAEKAPQSLKELQASATHIVTGKVQAIFSRNETIGNWNYTRYVAELRLTAVEKGDRLGKGQPAYVRYWRRSYRGLLPPPSTYGHSGLPKVGEEHRVFLASKSNDGYGYVNKDGGFDVLGPNGFQALKSSPRK